MSTSSLNRRSFLQSSALLGAATLPGLAAEPVSTRKLKIVCVGGHPDDPESGCAGTLALYAAQGHATTVIYLTRGERGIPNKSLDEAAAIRSAECVNACKLIGAKPVFFGQIDGATEFTRAHVDTMTRLLTAETPDLVLTHWPVDSHMDHQVASMLAIRACMALKPRPPVYFFEVNTGSQAQGFFPNTYVDVTPVLEKKKEALVVHLSQDGLGTWKQHHEVIANWRGREAGVGAAEAFVQLNHHSQHGRLPGV